MAHDHSEGFLNLVKDAKARVTEEGFRDTKKRIDRGEKFVLVDTREDSEWARGHIPGAIHLSRGSSSETSKRLSLTKIRASFCIAAGAIVPRSLPTTCKKWAIAT